MSEDIVIYSAEYPKDEPLWVVIFLGPLVRFSVVAVATVSIFAVLTLWLVIQISGG